MNIQSFTDAVKYLNNQDYSTVEIKKYNNQKEDFRYDKSKEVSNIIKAKNYLINERGIKEEVIDDLYKQGLIRQDYRGNILFLYKKNDAILGVSEQGTVKHKGEFSGRDYWKSIQKNSEPWGFNFEKGKPKNIKIFESPIDALSYVSIYGIKDDTRYISMDGLKENVIFNHIKDIQSNNIEIKEIELCVDNDCAGRKFTDKLMEYTKTHEVPLKKNLPVIPVELNEQEINKFDWNDMLKYYNKNPYLLNNKYLDTNEVTQKLLNEEGINIEITDNTVSRIKSFNKKIIFKHGNNSDITVFDTIKREYTRSKNNLSNLYSNDLVRNFSQIDIFDNPIEALKNFYKKINTNPSELVDKNQVSIENLTDKQIIKQLKEKYPNKKINLHISDKVNHQTLVKYVEKNNLDLTKNKNINLE